VELVLDTMRFSIDQRYKSGLYDDSLAIAESVKTAVDREIVAEVDKIMTLENEGEREAALMSLKHRHESFLNRPVASFSR
jgi:hypothetical protein